MSPERMIDQRETQVLGVRRAFRLHFPERSLQLSTQQQDFRNEKVTTVERRTDRKALAQCVFCAREVSRVKQHFSESLQGVWIKRVDSKRRVDALQGINPLAAGVCD